MVNPKVLAESVETKEDWETSLTIPFVKTLCKRPVGIQVAYIND